MICTLGVYYCSLMNASSSCRNLSNGLQYAQSHVPARPSPPPPTITTINRKIRQLLKHANASFTPVRHLCSVVRHPSSVISRLLQSLSFTPISLFRAMDTDFCVPTVLNRYSPGKWLTEALFVGNSLSSAHYHDLWSASVIRRPLKSLPDRFCLTMDDGRRMAD